MRLAIALLIATPVAAQDMGFDPGHPMPERPEFRVDQPIPSLADPDSTALLAFALASTFLDLSRTNSLSGGLGVNPDGETAGALSYSRGFGDWAAGLSLVTDGSDVGGSVFATYSWD